MLRHRRFIERKPAEGTQSLKWQLVKGLPLGNRCTCGALKTKGEPRTTDTTYKGEGWIPWKPTLSSRGEGRFSKGIREAPSGADPNPEGTPNRTSHTQAGIRKSPPAALFVMRGGFLFGVQFCPFARPISEVENSFRVVARPLP